MKRRDFLIGTAGVLGSSVPGLSGAAARPCPPSPFGVRHGSQVVANCSGLPAEQDWLARSQGAGVVWAHDFRLEAEIKNFRQSQDATDLNGVRVKQSGWPDPNGLGYHTIDWGTDKITGTNGRSLLTYAPKAFGAGKYFSNENAYAKSVGGAGDGSNVYSSYGAAAQFLTVQKLCGLEMIGGGAWLRPFAPLRYPDGTLPDDWADGGTMLRHDFNVTSGAATYFQNNPFGYFQHSDYTTQQQIDTGKVIGDEFWLQFRVKLNAGRFAYRNDPSGTGSGSLKADYVANKPLLPLTYGKQFTPYGKLAFLDKFRGAEQTIIPISGSPLYEYFYPGGQPFNWYASYGGINSAWPVQSNPSISSWQRGSSYELTCTSTPLADLTQQNMCWMWQPDEWVTVLCHIKPGHQNTVKNGPNADTLVEFKVARDGATSYTTIYSANRGFLYSDDSDIIRGWCRLMLDCYFNSIPSFAYISHTYTQIILSKQEIPCPQVY